MKKIILIFCQSSEIKNNNKALKYVKLDDFTVREIMVLIRALFQKSCMLSWWWHQLKNNFVTNKVIKEVKKFHDSFNIF